MPDTPTALQDLPLFAPRRTDPPVTTPSPTRTGSRRPAGPGHRVDDRPTSNHNNPRTTPATTTDPAGTDVDWALVRAFRQQAADELSTILRDRDGIDKDQERLLGEQLVDDLVADHATAALTSGDPTVTGPARARLKQAITDALFGMGRLQPLVDDHQIENIEVFGHDNVWLEYADGRIERGRPVADSDEELIETLAFIGARSAGNERPFSAANPRLHMRLDGGARLAASAWISPRPVVVIRRHRLTQVTLDDLVNRTRPLMSTQVADFLRAAVRAGKSIVVAGPQGAGKTTLVRALAAAMDPWERVGTIETEYELHLHELTEQHHRVAAWEARPGSGEIAADGKRAGEVTLDDLVYDSWRFSLQRLIIGECRGSEVGLMLSAMAGGTGSLTTLHASDARAAVERMVTLVMAGGGEYTFARRQVAEHIDFIVQLDVKIERDTNHAIKHRYISEIIAVELGEENNVATTDLFTAPRRSVTAVLRHLPQHLVEDLEDHGDYRPARPGERR